MLKRLATAVMLIALSTGPLIAQQADNGLTFEYLPIDDPRAKAIWGDDYGQDDVEFGAREPQVLIAEVTAPDGDLVQLSQFFGPISCGAMSCPVRMVKAGEVVLDTTACDNAEMYAFGAGMSTLFLCDQVIPTGFEREAQ